MASLAILFRRIWPATWRNRLFGIFLMARRPIMGLPGIILCDSPDGADPSDGHEHECGCGDDRRRRVQDVLDSPRDRLPKRPRRASVVGTVPTDASTSPAKATARPRPPTRTIIGERRGRARSTRTASAGPRTSIDAAVVDSRSP